MKTNNEFISNRYEQMTLEELAIIRTKVQKKINNWKTERRKINKIIQQKIKNK